MDKRIPVPRYAQAMQYIEDMIREKRLGPGDQLPAERNLAKSFQVSQTTMNRAVLEMVRRGRLFREVGRGTFVAGGPDRPLEQGTIGLVSLFSPDVAVARSDSGPDPYTAEILQGTRNATRDTGWDLRLLELSWDDPEPLGARFRNRADAYLILSPPDEALPALRQLRGTGLPFLVVGSSWPEEDIPAVDSDNVLGATLAVDHLADLGHTRLGMVGAPERLSNARDRHIGFVGAVHARGLCHARAWYVPDCEGAELMVEQRRRIVAMARDPEGPTALLVAGYFPAINTIETLSLAGLAVPHDMSVVGFDDKFSAAFLDPPLTTIAQPLVEMGARAVHRLQAIARGEAAGGIERMPTRLVVRESAGAPSPRG